MSAASPFDPELEALVQEIARDPRSCLLRIERPQRPLRLEETGEALSSGTPGLSVAEREILRVHRAEFASLLLRRWQDEVEQRPPPGHFIVSGSKEDSSASHQPSSSTDPSAMFADQGLDDASDEHLLGLLNSSRTLSSQELTQLAATAVRIHPTTTSRIYLAYDLTRSAQPRSAIRLLGRLLELETRPVLRSYCWSALASAHPDNWNPTELTRWYSRACDTSNPQVDALGFWLLMAAQNGDVASARVAAARLDDLVAPEDPRIARHYQNQLRTQAEGRWLPRATGLSILEALLASVGPTSRRLLHVLR